MKKIEIKITDNIFVTADNKIYEGQFILDHYYDSGTLICINADVYVGQFNYSLYHGFGVLTFSNGTRYIGDFEYGKFVGNIVQYSI